MKRFLYFPILPILFTPAIALAQFAQSDKIKTSLTSKALPWAAGIGVAWGAIGLVRAGMKYSSGDADAKEHAKGAVIGSVLALSAGTLMAMLSSWFG